MIRFTTPMYSTYSVRTQNLRLHFGALLTVGIYTVHRIDFRDKEVGRKNPKILE